MLLLFVYIFLCGCHPAKKQDNNSPYGSLKISKIYCRYGPGKEYPIKLEFTKKNWPIKVIASFDHWKKIADPDGVQGWIKASAISSKKSAFIVNNTDLYKAPDSIKIGFAEKGAVGVFLQEKDKWSLIKFKETTGWILTKDTWGIKDA